MSLCGIDRSFTIFVEGNIGSGKSTFLKYFTKFSDIFVALEPVESWQDVNGHNILELMYRDPSRWSFAFQSVVQQTMLGIHTQKCQEPIKLMERSLQSGRYIFIENLHRQNLMSQADYTVLTSFYESLSNNFDIHGDLIIYLRSDPEIVYRRMLGRARVEEEQVSLEYLQQIHQLHENWLIHKTMADDVPPVLVLNANCSLISMEEEFKKCENIILSHLHNLEEKSCIPDIFTISV